MMKKICVLLLCWTVVGGARAADFDFSEFAITDGADANFLLDPVAINDSASGKSVAEFDIAGVMLGMGFDDVYTQFFDSKGLYAPRAKNSVVYALHKDWKYNLDYECRQEGVFIPEKLEQCIRTLAKNRGLLYASEIHLVRENTGETLDVYFTSNATDNVVWRIEYNNDVNELEGESEKFENQRDKKILVFWQNVLDKYGAPNSGTDKWVSSDNAYDPMMTAYYGALELVDNGRRATDESRNIQQARENFKAKSYAF